VTTQGVGFIQAVPLFANPDEFASAGLRSDAGVEESIEDLVGFGESAGGDEASCRGETQCMVYDTYRFAGKQDGCAAGWHERVDSHLRRVQNHEAAFAGEYAADAPAVVFERAMERHPQLGAQITCDLGQRPAMGGNPEDRFEVPGGFLHETVGHGTGGGECAWPVGKNTVKSLQIWRERHSRIDAKLDAPEPTLQPAHGRKPRCSGIEKHQSTAQHLRERAFFQEKDGDAGIGFLGAAKKEGFPPFAGPAQKVRRGREKKNENVGGKAQLGGGDQVLAKFYYGVWREGNRIASGSEKGAEFLRERRVHGSVRGENGKQSSVYGDLPWCIKHWP
jgi:hypothetical protein